MAQFAFVFAKVFGPKAIDLKSPADKHQQDFLYLTILDDGPEYRFS